jgi:hypothetical protein
MLFLRLLQAWKAMQLLGIPTPFEKNMVDQRSDALDTALEVER